MRRKVLEWYEKATESSPDDMKNTWYFGGDPDEIPRKEFVARVKHCYLSPKDKIKFFVLEQCMYRQNFERTEWGDAGWKMAMLSMVDNVTKVLFRKGKTLMQNQYMSLRYTGMHVNRVTDPYTNFMKILTISEGGQMNGKPLNKVPKGMDALWKDPTISQRWRVHGYRTCCTSLNEWSTAEGLKQAQRKYTGRLFKEHPFPKCPVPWVALHNPHRYKWVWPSLYPLKALLSPWSLAPVSQIAGSQH